MTYRIIDFPGRLQITVLDEPGLGGPDHRHSNLYCVGPLDESQNPCWQGGVGSHFQRLLMQNGRLSDGKPANGLTEAVLLAIVVDRLRELKSPALLECAAALAAVQEWQEAVANI